MNKKINSSMELPELLTVILDVAKDIVNAEASSLLLTDPKSGDLIFNIVSGGKKEIMGEKVPKGSGIAGTVAETGKPLIVNDVRNDPRHFDEIDKKFSFTTKSILCVPMEMQGKLLGVLEAVNAVDREGFSDWDQELLSYIAEHAAIAIFNRMLYDDLTSRIKELTALYDISQSISFADPDESIFKKIIISLAESLEVEKASILFYDNSRQKFILTASYGLPDYIADQIEINTGDSISGFVKESGNTLIVSDIGNEVTFPYEKRERFYKTGAFISTPIRLKNEIIGVLNLADKKNGLDFTSFDHQVISTIGTSIAGIYQELIYQKKIKSQKRLSQEINIAAEIQRKILPVIPLNVAGHEVGAFNKPAKEIGGDFYDLFKFDDNKYAVLVADVSGKGIPAALFMGTARNILRAETRFNNQPGRLLTTANQYIYQDSEHGMFVTAFYMLIDPHNNLLYYGNAGHNDQILIRAKTKSVEKLNADGKALGLKLDSRYEERAAIFEHGDVVLLFTDGVLEYLGSGDIEKGENTLIQKAIDKLDYHPSEFIGTYKNELEKIDLDDEVIDDFTILSIKF
ncbi:MAG: SpoIIE family protein phosphatase [Spirochaetes bacterium]|nr:SpoIIE family protein phosphatase [Spirochaetota bacterium]